MTKFMVHLFAAFGGLAAGAVAMAAPALSQITLQYNERPPFMEARPDGGVEGIVATPVARTFQKIGEPVAWVAVPVARQLAILQRNNEAICSVGWYKTAEREKFAKFSNPVSQDSPMIGLANRQLSVAADIGLDDLLADPAISVVVKQSIIYTPFLDAKFAAMKAKRIDVSAEFGPIVHMIEVGRASLTFVPLEEASYYIRKAGMNMAQFQVLHFAGMPPGEKRYLMCSRKVPDALISRFNTYLPDLATELAE